MLRRSIQCCTCLIAMLDTFDGMLEDTLAVLKGDMQQWLNGVKA